MGSLQEGRHTTPSEDDVTVFLVGMRFNQPWKVHRWLPVFLAMPRMLTHLERHPEAGLLGHHLWAGRTMLVVSYWRSPDHLQRFAADRDAPHLAAWRRFQRRAAAGGRAVGVFHETYVSHPGEREAVYVDMPRFGLAAATSSAPVDERTRTARQRLAAGRSSTSR